MEWVETTGDTESAARQAAADRLGVVAAEIEVDVIEAAGSSLFGLRKTPARIRARVRPTAPPPKIERHERRGRSGSRRPSRVSGKSTGDAKKPREGVAKRGGTASSSRGGPGSSKSTSSRTKAKSRSQQTEDLAKPTTTTARSAAPPGTKRRSRKLTPATAVRLPETGGAPLAFTPGPSGSKKRRVRRIDLPKKEETTMSDETTIEEQGDIVAKFLEGLVESFGLDATTSVTSTEDDYIDVKIDGSDLGVLIGPGGHTLASLGEVAKTALQRQLGGSSRSRVRVDIAGYRALRREALESFTAEVASNVRGSGAKHAFEPMNATDRKIVHDAVGTLDGVGSESDGEEPRRRVVVVPA